MSMICDKCKYEEDCDWYGSYKRINMEISLGIGTDNAIGNALAEAIRENSLDECEYFEQ